MSTSPTRHHKKSLGRGRGSPSKSESLIYKVRNVDGNGGFNPDMKKSLISSFENDETISPLCESSPQSQAKSEFEPVCQNLSATSCVEKLSRKISDSNQPISPSSEEPEYRKVVVIAGGDEDELEEEIEPLHSHNVLHSVSSSSPSFTLHDVYYLLRGADVPKNENQDEQYFDCESQKCDSLINSAESVEARIAEIAAEFEKKRSQHQANLEYRMDKILKSLIAQYMPDAQDSDTNPDEDASSETYSFVSAQQEQDLVKNLPPQVAEKYKQIREWLQESSLFHAEESSDIATMEDRLSELISDLKGKKIDYNPKDIYKIISLLKNMFGDFKDFSVVDPRRSFPPSASLHADLGFPPKFLERMTSLLDTYPAGIHYRLFASAFRDTYGYALNPEGYGYTGLKHFFQDLTDVFTFAESQLFKKHLHLIILFPTHLVDSICELDVLVVRLWHWILLKTWTEKDGYVVVETLTESYAREVMEFKPSIWGLPEERDGWLGFIEMMMDHGDSRDNFMLGQTVIQDRTLHVLYRVSKKEFVEEYILDIKKEKKKKKKGNYNLKHMQKCKTSKDSKPMDPVCKNDIGDSLDAFDDTGEYPKLELGLDAFLEEQRKLQVSSNEPKPWDKIDFFETGEHYFDDNGSEFANEFDEHQMKGDELIPGEVRACLFRDAISENLDFWLVNALDWEHAYGIHNYMK